MTKPTLPTHVIVAPSYWAATWFARKHKLDPACWMHVVSEEMANDLIARSKAYGVSPLPIIVTPTTIPANPVQSEAAA